MWFSEIIDAFDEQQQVIWICRFTHVFIEQQQVILRTKLSHERWSFVDFWATTITSKIPLLGGFKVTQKGADRPSGSFF